MTPDPGYFSVRTRVLQQLALAASLLRGLDPDAPVGLSKVTATH